MNSSVVRRVLVLLILLSTSAPRAGSDHSIPGWLIAGVEKELTRRVGKQFFEQNCEFLPDRSTYEPGSPDCRNCADFLRLPHYYLLWQLQISGKPFVNETVQVVVDQKGNLIGAPYGLPNCKKRPSACVFSVDEEEAIRIAHEARLEVGIRAWETSFHWYAGELRTYVWTVTTTLSKGPDGGARGRTVVIDASNGRVHHVSEWSSVH